MNTKLYIGNLPFSATEEDLHDKFAQIGTVKSFKLIVDRDTNQSKGFGFLEMSSEDEAQAVIDELDGTDYQGRSMRVNEARPKEGGGGGGRGHGGGGRGGDYRGGGGGGRGKPRKY